MYQWECWDRTCPSDCSVGTKGVSQNHLLSFDDNKVLKLSIGYAKHLFSISLKVGSLTYLTFISLDVHVTS